MDENPNGHPPEGDDAAPKPVSQPGSLPEPQPEPPKPGEDPTISQGSTDPDAAEAAQDEAKVPNAEDRGKE